MSKVEKAAKRAGQECTPASRYHAADGCCSPAAAPLTATALRPGSLAMRGPALVKERGTGAVTGEGQLHRMVVAHL